MAATSAPEPRRLRLVADRAGIHARLIGSFLSAWVLFPLVLLGASVGCGLLVRRVAGGELSNLLVAPVGFALVVAICAFATSYGWLAPAAGPVAAAVAAVGLVLEARARPLAWPRPRAAWGWPVIAALVAFAAVGGPVFLTGSVGWTGYTRIVDIAFQMDFAQHLADAGRVSPPNGHSSYNVVASKLLGIGYPGGSQATLGAIANLVGTNVAWCYQAFLAFAASMGAVAIYSVLGRMTRNGLMRCVAAAVAIQPNVLYAYALEAGIKELTTATLLMVAVAVLADRLPGNGLRRSVVPLAVAVSGAFGAFSLGIAPWLGLLLAGAFIVSLIRRSGRRYALESWGLFAAVAVVISLPGLVTAAKLANVAGTAVGGVVDLGLGNLAAPVSRWSSAGVWLTGDYRYPLAHTTTSHIFDAIIIALAVVGVLAGVVRRRWTLVVLGITTPIALDYFIKHSTAWIQFKAFTITAAFVVTLAFVGAAALQRMQRRWLSALGWVAALVVAGGVLYGNALIYHDTSLAPGARYHDLAAIAKRYAGQGPALDPYFDEYAEYFLRGEDGSTLVNPANLSLQVRPGVPLPPGGQSFAWDLNQLVPGYVQGFPLIIQPRSPTGSRAPSNYDLVEQTHYFDVWRRDRPSNTVVQHFPLSNLPHERTPALCRVVTMAARRAGPNAEVAYTKNATVAVVNPVEGTHPDYWKPLGPSTLAAYGAGTAQMRFVLPTSGRYSIWLQGSVGRPLAVYIDGRRLSSIGYEERYPDQFLLIAGSSLSAGRHTLRLVRGGGSLHPGSGDPPIETVPRTIGAIVFNREDSNANRVYIAPASQMARICAAPVGYEWLELLRRGAAPADALVSQL
ncbi:MAG: hypothetical protein JWO21_1055 [Solirubrobacterales bacterium]|nr:hypothetical protein [Solirubrobacterales bacterium]